MKRFLLTVCLLAIATIAFPQEKIIKKIKESVTKTETEAHLAFLASDEMRGRGTGSPEIAIAASYIATQFKLAGVKTVSGSNTYFQEVGLQEARPPKKVELKLGNDVFKFKDDLLVLGSLDLTHDLLFYSGDFVFVGYGNPDDFTGVDVKGKIVVAYTGTAKDTTARQAFGAGRQKMKLVSEKGGVALIEIAAFTSPPWQVITGFFSGSRVSLAREDAGKSSAPHLWMKKSASAGITDLIAQKRSVGTLTIESQPPKAIPGKNVIGVIEGADPKLKSEYIVLSAHYDHLGVRKNNTPDSIYNGARDNAMGTTAVLEAAKFLAKNPPKRSVLLITFCGEEKGLLGSNWYANHPLIPLSQTVYNLDCDGAGYNDKTIATLIDLNRTTADDLLKKGCEAFGLMLHGDPVPEQNLYERSDNYNFAEKGVPAVDFSTGVKSFDEELMKYYHQPADEVGSLDMDYMEKFFRAYVYAAFLISDSPVRPTWKKGDKFEEAGKKLYGGK